MKFSTSLFMTCIAVAPVLPSWSAYAATEVPKEGTYDYIACWSGTVSEMKLSGGAVARTVEFTGAIHAKDPGSIFDNNSFRCMGVGVITTGKMNAGITTGQNICTAIDQDGDTRTASFTTGEDGKTVRKELGGTGKFDGMVTSNQTIEQLGPMPTIQPGTLQSCNHQTGNYKLK
jgi:hypothetical protein